MAFDHRKLISDPVNTNIGEICEAFCNITSNPDGFCPAACINSCYPICYRPLIFVIPSPDLPTTASAHHSQKTHNLHLLLIISLSILAATCLLFCLYKFYKRRDISRRRRLSSSQPQQEETTHDEFLEEDHGPMVDHPIWYIRTVGLQTSIINSITVCRYKRGDGLVEGTECSVCLSEFQEDETLRLLPKCNHAFHIPCIDTWLRSHTNCPMCRAPIVVSNTAGLPGPVPMPMQGVDDNRIIGGESQVVVSESGGEFWSGREDGDCELTIGTEEEGETQVENRAERAEPSMEEVDEFQPMRRSVSMDSVSASMISVAVANAHLRESAKVNKSNRAIVPKKDTVNQSLPRLMGGSSMKRSLSCSGKVFLSRYTRSRSRNTVLPS